MVESYSQLSASERSSIYLLHAAGKSGTTIAGELHRDKSTISCELRRNKINGLYLPDSADSLAKERRWRGSKIERDAELLGYITSQIAMAYWSPDRLAGKMRFDKTPFYACSETIYRLFTAPQDKPITLFRISSGQNRSARLKWAERHAKQPSQTASLSI